MGNYAYTKINQILDNYQFGYRVLALTATPGNDIEKIQALIDNLAIAKIEVRKDSDPEVFRYMQSKQVFPIVISSDMKMTQLEYGINELAAKVLAQLSRMLNQSAEQQLQPKDPCRLNYFQVNSYYESFKRNMKTYENFMNGNEISDIYDAFKTLRRLTQSKKQLNDQGFQIFKISIKALKKMLQKCSTNFGREFLALKEFKALYDDLETFDSEKMEDHPKMRTLKELLQQFFSNPLVLKANSKAIVFTHNRASATQIVKALEPFSMIKAKEFVGQPNNKKNDVGLTQQQQIELINEFKENRINVLVATCVAEEGLDIGEVDFIICYDSGLSPIRLVQRMGRTGRKRAGKITLLLNNVEYSQYKSSNFKYKKVIDELKRSKDKTDVFKFYGYNPKMIPDDYKTMKLVCEDKDGIVEETSNNELFEKIEDFIEEILRDQEMKSAKKASKKKTTSARLDNFFGSNKKKLS